MSDRPNGQVSAVHVLAWFICDFCGGDAQRMSKAPVHADGRVGPVADRPPGEIECNECFTARRKREEEAGRQRRFVAAERRAWAAKKDQRSWAKKARSPQ